MCILFQYHLLVLRKVPLETTVHLLFNFPIYIPNILGDNYATSVGLQLDGWITMAMSQVPNHGGEDWFLVDKMHQEILVRHM